MVREKDELELGNGLRGLYDGLHQGRLYSMSQRNGSAVNWRIKKACIDKFKPSSEVWRKRQTRRM